jgi:hypothetical protein
MYDFYAVGDGGDPLVRPASKWTRMMTEVPDNTAFLLNAIPIILTIFNECIFYNW